MWDFATEFSISVEYLIETHTLKYFDWEISKIIDGSKNNGAAHWSSRLLKIKTLNINWRISIMIILFS